MMLTKVFITAIVLLGVILKLIDDFYDMNLFSPEFINLLELLFYGLLIYIFTNSASFTLVTFFTVIACILSAGEMQDKNNKQIFSYWLINIVTIGFFIYYYQMGKYDNFLKNINKWVYLMLFMYIMVYIIENQLFPEDYSNRKLKFRIWIVIFFLLSLIYFYIKIYPFNQIQEIFIFICYFGLGYFGTSIMNLYYYKNSHVKFIPNNISTL